ncbi:MAG: 1-acyl-sn-glycerol-3-phosphate acyltransferase [Thalassospira sp.]|uniref:lysophospholipid acyltransferase family protein n=1 Tax=Thalassospira sp. TaxID=1912094 RepID=UPI0032EE9661
MRALRALLFNVLFFGGTALLCISMIPLMVCGRKASQFVGHAWCRLTQAALNLSVGMHKRITGLENLPDGPCILVAKHQSAWETLTFHTVVPDPAYILKKELTRIPLVGQFLLLSGQIAVDRSAGGSALKDMIKGASQALKENRQVIIFPEGTRTPPGSSRPYHPGVYALYKAFPDTKVIPVAVNSGMFWGKDSFMKYGGRVTMELMKPIEPGLDRKTFMSEIKTRIDTRTRELETEAQREFSLPMLTSADIAAQESLQNPDAGQVEKDTAS